MTVWNLNTESTDRQAQFLFGHVEGLKVRFGCERSVRICDEGLLPDRFLLSLSKDSIPHRPHEQLLNLCREIGMPAEYQAAVQMQLSAARFVHFGFEAGRSTRLYKVYLEMPILADEPVHGAPVLLHTAYKWDVGNPAKRTITKYHWYPSLSVAEIRQRLFNIYAGERSLVSREIVENVLDFTASRMDPADLKYLEVTEENHPRNSYDLNLYDAELCLHDLAPFLTRMCQRFSVSPEQYRSFFGAAGNQPVGHLAGGIHREGQDFFNVYYGVEERQG